MPDLPLRDDVLRVRKLTLELEVCGDRAQASSAQARLESLLGAELARTGTRSLESLSRSHDGIWFVQRLTFDADLDLELLDAALASAWTRQLVAAVQRQLSDPDPNEVRHFADHGAYLAAFLVDRARGSGWNAWYYAAFDGLSALPASAALRTAVLADPELGRTALTGLSRLERVEVLSALSASDARRVFERLADGPTGARPSPELARALARLARRDGAYHTPGEAPFRLALGLELEALAAHPDLDAGELARLACAAAFLASSNLAERTQREPALVARLLRADSTELFATFGASGGEWLPHLLALDAELLRELVAAMANDEPESLDRDEPRFTRYGGIFLLFPSLARLERELAETCAAWSEPPGGDRASALRLLVLGECLSPGATYDLLRDPVTRDLCGVPAALNTRALEPWLASTGGAPAIATIAERVLADFARRLPGFAASSPPYLRRNFLDLRASLVLESHRYVVRLERVPLNTILNMTGLTRARYSLPWLAGPPFELYQEGPT